MTKLQHHQQYLIEEFAEAYLEHRLDRRDLLKRVLVITGSVPLTASTLLMLGCGDSDDEAAAPPGPTVPPVVTTEAGVGPGVSITDPAVKAEDVSFKGPATDVKGYLARPAADGRYPAVLVIPENAGLLDHYKDVARRFAKEGFVGFAIDPVSRQGGTTTDTAVVMAAYRSPTFVEDFVADSKAALDYLKTQSFVRANAFGVTGYCIGGNLTFEVALANPDVKAAAPYYGTVDMAKLERLRSTQAAIFAFYGADDARITAQAPQVEEQLKASGKPYDIRIFPGTGHSFFNDTRPRSGNFGYVQESATEAWKLTLAWFRRHLTG